MAQFIIVTTPVNSGDGTSLATAFNYCNSNFSELYSRAQVTPPATLIGAVGDTAGMYASDETYFYYCYANYDGSSTIWGQVTQIGNVSISTLSNGNSNIRIADVDGNVSSSVDGVANVVVVASTGQYVTGVISSTGNITGDYILGNGSQLTGLPETYANANVASYLPVYSGNISANNVSVATAVDVTGNVTGGNILSDQLIESGGNIVSQGTISAVGNIETTGYFVGTFVGNVTGNFVVPGSNTQVIFNTNGNASATAGLTFDTDGPNLLSVLGNVQASNVVTTGNVNAGNVRTTGVITATGNITGGNLSGTNIAGILSTAAQPNITSVGTLSSLTVTANIVGGNISTAGRISATGNIVTAGFLSVTQDINAGGDITATTYSGNTMTLLGNITSANISTGGTITAVGNISGNYISGNGSQLTGLLTNSIQNGNSSVLIGSSAGNVSINVNGVSPVVLVNPLGMSVSGVIDASANITGGNLSAGSGSISTTGNITGGNILGGANVNATTHTGVTVSVSANITGGNLLTGGIVSATGNITGGNLVTAGVVTVNSGGAAVAIVNGGSNGVGNIGSTNSRFNTVFAVATSAQYADLAENYISDFLYAPGTVVVFGGDEEITTTTEFADTRVAGAISTNPAYLMNDAMPGAAVALRGRVPVIVVGPVTKGDSLVTSTTAGRAVSIGHDRTYGQAVFAKALETNTDPGEKIIQAVIL
jgi:hypothetical protein